MIDFHARVDQPEVMDAPGLDEAVYQRCLRDLATVNRVTFTHLATLRWLARAIRGLPRGAEFSVLDVAYGQGDLLRAIARFAARRGFAARLTGVDLNPRSEVAARAATPAGLNIEYSTGDVFEFIPATAPDFIVTSQFTHHLSTPQIIALLRWLEKNARRGWYITDLQRHKFAYYAFPLLARLLRWHPIVRQDGAASIAQSFRREDWQEMLNAAEITAGIRWQMPFRYGISRLK